MASMLILGLIPLLQQPGLMPEMEEQRQKLLAFFTDVLPKLADVELRAEADPHVRTLLDDLKAVEYNADNIVDDFRYAKLQAEAEAEGYQNGNGDRVRAGLFLFSCFKICRMNRSGVLQGIENRVGSIVKRIDDLVERMRALKFYPGQEINITTSAESRQQLIFSSPTEIVGRDKEKEDLVNALLSKQSYIYSSIKQIVGPQGIGKTALIRSVCNDTRISNHYEYVLWVEVGPEFHIGKVMKTIIDQVTGRDCFIFEGYTDLLVLNVYQELRGKRYIVVLDDVWAHDEQQLVKFESMIQHGVLGNCLIVIRRFHGDVQMFKRMSESYVLEPLMPKDGWNLFCKKAFSDDATETCPEILEEMGKEIMVICGGSPLAVNMMGGLMRFKKGPEEWQGVINQLKKEVLNDIGAATVERIIKVCYDNLCYQVKQCFAVCSLFPKGHYMDKEVLIKLWMANGFLLPSDGWRSMPLEENGNNVFNELASRHFFEDVKLVHKDSYGNKHGYHSSRVTCKLSDLIHDQAVIAAREFAQQIPYMLSTSGDSYVDIPKVLLTNPTIRILFFPDEPLSRTVNCSVVPKANSLRVLHMHSALFVRGLLELKHMRHLRYLDLSKSRIEALPEDTSLLYFLQTLNLSKCFFLYQLPENMRYMRSLRHLYIDNCPNINKMPAHIRQLINLKTLTTYIVGEESTGTSIDQIKFLHLGGLLELYNLYKVKNAAIAKEADLISKRNLDRLTLCWGREQLVMSKQNNDFEVLEALQPHTQLKVLKIQQYGGNEFATWLANPVAGLVNLVELHFIGCSNCTTLPAVWKLACLRVLCLKHMPRLSCISCVDENDTSELYFPSLKRLVLVGLKRLERWHEEKEVIDTIIGGESEEEEKGGATFSNLKSTSEEVTFTVLDELEITSCPYLKTMPRAPQLKHITASIENYKLLQSVTDLITQKQSLVEEVTIAKANDAHNEPFPELGTEVEDRVNMNLRTMRMDSTNSIFMPTNLPHSLMGLWRPFKRLQYLEIINCNTLVSWPLEFRYLKNLIRLSIRKCPNLTGKLPAQAKKNISLFPELQKLEFYGCSSLKQVSYCTKLNVLALYECPEVESVLVNTSFYCMDILYLSCTRWTSLPSELGTTEMKTLCVSECYSLTSLPDWLAHKVHLKNLIINECPLLKELPGGHEWLSSLKKLQISNCPVLEKFCKQEPYSSIISQIGKSDGIENDDDEDHELATI